MIITLRAARVNRNMTLLEASKYLKINKDTLTKYERDSSDIPYSLSKRMQELYEVPAENLFFGDVNTFVAHFKPLPEL
ncbi:Helix-turn-helix domain-containing protein [Granulicatella balaenopterae]|uniref:Helix-turn-helix domain-containing protein n=1 Tax=Granulicatella balaenopterae TaxID=137733 RepID=A0A1H9K244_9LACT|nr:helix-turn-helix transcriptional regulator [Granulicatella balaenopterae]SEQ93058.1 Helix-turn-helix domain-containing protein [Granulicatella balaenopterae]